MTLAPGRAGASAGDAMSLTLTVSRERDHHIVEAVGAVTGATRNELFCRCLAPGQSNVVLDMTKVSHFDGDGYAAVVAARRILESEGGSLTMRNLAAVPRDAAPAAGDQESGFEV